MSSSVRLLALEPRTPSTDNATSRVPEAMNTIAVATISKGSGALKQTRQQMQIGDVPIHCWPAVRLSWDLTAQP